MAILSSLSFYSITFFYITAVILPVVFWLWFFLWRDRAEPEPKKLLAKAFLWGIGVAIIAGIIEAIFFSIAFPAEYKALSNTKAVSSPLLMAIMLSLAGPIEETLKYLLLKKAVFKKEAFNQIADGVMYAITLALGFAIIENTFYFIDLYTSQATFIFIATSIIRGVETVLVHVTSTGILGLYLGRAKFASSKKTLLLFKGLLIAWFLHGMFNFFLAFSQSYGELLGFLPIFLGFLLLLRALQKPETQMMWRVISPPQVHQNPQN